MENNDKNVVVVANGNFPTNEIPLGYLREAEVIVCCDGSVGKVVDAGFLPYVIVGDMDSLDSEMMNRFSDRLVSDYGQETNDLTKAVRWCVKSGFDNIVILGATGIREDHTIGNVSLLADYVVNVNVMMVTDNGVFLPIKENTRVPSFPGQQVSLFSFSDKNTITTNGLKYPLEKRQLNRWWEATLNEATGYSFDVEFSVDVVILFMEHPVK